MKDCAFQLAVDGKMLEDTDLICRADAEELWQKYVPVFKQAVCDGIDAEMALWIDMEHSTNYRKKSAHWHSQDMIIDRGSMYERRRVA